MMMGSLTQPAAAQPTTTSAASAATAAETLPWRDCRDGYQCARMPVPLDYDHPNGEQTFVSVIRLPAAVPGERIGSLVLNPGGPGGSGVDIARGIAPVLPLELRAKFDIVGFDPRGVERSTPLQCYATFDEALNHLPSLAYPVTQKEENSWIKSDKRLARACRNHAGRILGHMSTADVARDMDVLRQAVGDQQLNYLGYSYGSMLGQTYANLFPSKSRAMVIDGVIDPVAWAGAGPRGARVPFATRIKSAQGAGATLRAFFRLCDAAGRECSFSGDSRKRYNTLARTLRKHPIDYGEGFRFTYNDLVANTLGGLYSSYSFPELADFLRDIEDESASAPRSLARLRAKIGLAAPQEDYPNFIESFPGVSCSDGNNPRTYRPYRRSADRAAADWGHFGRLWNWQASVCAVWPKRAGQDQHLGPWTAATPNPVLVVGNYYDPATPYSGAQAANRLLPNSRLLSYAGWGHTAFFTGNYCIDAAVTSYLVTTVPPAAGTVCQPAGSPFGALEARRAKGAARSAEILAATMPNAVRQADGRR